VVGRVDADREPVGGVTGPRQMVELFDQGGHATPKLGVLLRVTRLTRLWRPSSSGSPACSGGLLGGREVVLLGVPETEQVPGRQLTAQQLEQRARRGPGEEFPGAASRRLDGDLPGGGAGPLAHSLVQIEAQAGSGPQYRPDPGLVEDLGLGQLVGTNSSSSSQIISSSSTR
jgi:hypothetical protein